MKRILVFTFFWLSVGLYGFLNLGTNRQLIDYQAPNDPVFEVVSFGHGWLITKVPSFTGFKMHYRNLKTQIPVPMVFDLEFDLLWPDAIYKREAFVLRAVAKRTVSNNQPTHQSIHNIQAAKDPLGAVLVSLSVAGAIIEPEEPQKIAADGSISWSVKFEDQGSQSGVLRVSSSVDGVVVKTTEVTSQVTVRNDFEFSFQGIFALVSGVVGFFIGLVGFVWKYRDRQRANAAEAAETEAKKRRLILPGD